MPKTKHTEVKPGWKCPEHITMKCSVCSMKIKPIAYFDYDSWALSGWDCENFCGAIDDLDDFEWPFSENFAMPDDLEFVGFVIV